MSRPSIDGQRALLATIGAMRFDLVRKACDSAFPSDYLVKAWNEIEARYPGPEQQPLRDFAWEEVEKKFEAIDPYDNEEFKSGNRMLDLLEKAARR